MRTLKVTLLAVFLLLLLPAKSIAQNQLVWIHEDHVKPSMSEEYAKLAKELADACTKHSIPDVNWMMIQLDNGTYRYVSLMPNMAALDKNPFAPLADKMGKEKLDAIFSGMDKCYDRHNSYMISNVKDLTYMPEGYSLSTPGLNYRKFYTLFVTPSTTDVVAAKIKIIKELYAKKGAKEYFRIYHSGLGCAEEFYTVVISAKDEADYRRNSDETEKLLGEEGKKAIDDLFDNVLRYDVSTGYARPDLSYAASNNGKKS